MQLEKVKSVQTWTLVPSFAPVWMRRVGAGAGALALVGSSTSATVGVPLLISPSGRGREFFAGEPSGYVSSSVPGSEGAWNRQSGHMTAAKGGEKWQWKS